MCGSLPTRITGPCGCWRLRIPTDLAVRWLREYLDGEKNPMSSEPYAYPAYDLVDAEDNDPHRLRDADLLALSSSTSR